MSDLRGLEPAAPGEVQALRDQTPMIAIETTAIPLDDVRDSVRRIQEAHGPMLDAFHKVSYHSFTWSMTTWMGVPLLKHPCDLIALQEIVAGIRPALIIETGTAYGGSALYLAHLCDLLGHGQILTIDLEPAAKLPQHPRITYRVGSSVDDEIVGYVSDRAARCGGPVLVLLDSNHSQAHVAAELVVYAPLVTPGSFVVVEDTNVNGNPVLPEHGPGPREAVDAFLAGHRDFERDPLPERFLISMHPGGWLRRIA
jgi:cephalosporin hydroxylase